MKKEILRFSNVTITCYRHGGLDHISFSVYEGEVLAMAGTSTSGIKTLFRLLTGIQPGYSGSIFSDGSRICLNSPLEAKKNHISVLQAGAKVHDTLGIIENICLQEEIGSFWQFVKRQAVREKLGNWLEYFGFSNDRRLAGMLTEFEKKKLEILMALYANARVIVLSDIESWCSEQDAGDLAEIMQHLADAHIAVIVEYDSRFKYFTHLVNRCIPILRGNIAKTVFREGLQAVDEEKLTAIITGRGKRMEETPEAEDALCPKIEIMPAGKAGEDADCVLKMSGIMGIYDPGAKIPRQTDEFIAFLNGRYRVMVDGKQLCISSLKDAVSQRIAFISDNRHAARSAIFQNLSPAANACIFMKHIWKRRYLYSEKIEKYLLVHTAQRYELLKDLLEYAENQDCYQIKAKNEYQLTIAKWLVYNPQIVVIFSPFGNNDLFSRRKYMKLQHELAAEGKNVIVISCNYGDLSCCNKIYSFS